MIVYADILIFLNTVIDYCILISAGLIIGSRPKSWRLIAGSIFGGIFSLRIFLPALPLFADTLFLLLGCAIMSLITFGYKNIKRFIKVIFTVFAVSFILSGITAAVMSVFSPGGIAMNNSSIYISISPLMLIAISILAYIIIRIICFFFQNTEDEKELYTLNIQYGENGVTLTGLCDSGNSLCDPISGSRVIVAAHDTIYPLISQYDLDGEGDKPDGYRIIPYTAVGVSGYLPAFRPSGISINGGNAENVLIAVTKDRLSDEYSAIINAKIIKELKS